MALREEKRGQIRTSGRGSRASDAPEDQEEKKRGNTKRGKSFLFLTYSRKGNAGISTCLVLKEETSHSGERKCRASLAVAKKRRGGGGGGI